MKINLILTAGGTGKRFGSNVPKQLIKLEDKPILIHTLEKFVNISQISKIIIVLPQSEIVNVENLILDYKFRKEIKFVAGGRTRQESVFNGLEVCSKPDYVLIHDAVRPFIQESEIIDIIEYVKIKRAVIPISPVIHTQKKVMNNKIVETMSRENLFNVYTPQAFQYDIILKYHKLAKKENIEFTDDAGILEHYNIPVFVKETSPLNIKITTKDDLVLAKAILGMV